MSTYRVGIFEEQGGYTLIKAKSPKQAEKIALNKLEAGGFEEFKEVNTTHRDFSIVDGAKIIK